MRNSIALCVIGITLIACIVEDTGRCRRDDQCQTGQHCDQVSNTCQPGPVGSPDAGNGIGDLAGLDAAGADPKMPDLAQCVPQAGEDVPDDKAIDSNCDGLDGEVSNGVFVATPVNGGGDGGDGSRSNPVATITKAIELIKPTNKRYIYVSIGDYSEAATLNLPAGVNLIGGYDATKNWSRRPVPGVRPRVTVAAPTALELQPGSNDQSTIATLELTAASATSPGASSYGIHAAKGNNTMPSLMLTDVWIIAGNGADGANGKNGDDGSAGGPGFGRSGGAAVRGTSDGNSGFPGCGPAGRGGSVRYMNGSCLGASPGEDAASVTCPTPSPPLVGSAAPIEPSSFRSVFKPSKGGNGTVGQPGQGGAGGGGGSGGCAANTTGGAGGAGGGAGGPGGAGVGGDGGGGSFAVYSFGVPVTVTRYAILEAKLGGKGGDGGNGGKGGVGGSGTLGSPGSNSGAFGGKGAAGGTGGAGSAGAGGNGGPQIAVVMCNASLAVMDPLMTTRFLRPTNASPGGAGGTMPVRAPDGFQDQASGNATFVNCNR